MASKKPATTTQPTKERPKSRRIPKETPIPLVEPAPIEPVSKPVKPLRKGGMEKGSAAALEWGAKMKALKEAKKQIKS